jgi:heat shock protein HslJ
MELMGKPVGIGTVDDKEIHIKFIQEENKVEGFGGCNGFAGNNTTKNDFNISISNIILTMIACPDLDTENELFNVLKTANNYYVKGDTLSLNKATMAKFVKQ